MPQRFLRPGITNSERWNRASFKAQSLWIRLLTHVDDFGRYDGRPSVIWGSCFSIWNEQNPTDVVSPQETAALCAQLADIGLLHIYEVEGKKVVQITQWSERARAEKSKWPEYKGNSKNVVKPLRNPAESCGILPPSTSASTSTAPVRARAGDDANVPTWAEVKAEAEMRAVPEASAKSFFDHHEGNGLWLNRFENLINWKHKLISWAANDRQPKGNKNATSQRTAPDRTAGTYNAGKTGDGIKSKIR